jgi:hypothetical protein
VHRLLYKPYGDQRPRPSDADVEYVAPLSRTRWSGWTRSSHSGSSNAGGGRHDNWHEYRQRCTSPS